MSNNKKISIWLGFVIMLVFLTVFIGGATRLTHSGLSMVEWKPITGVLPPLNLQAWRQEFGKYKKSPQFLKVNFKMNLKEFKDIYFWEYLHRVLGRLIGLVYFIPLLFFIFWGYFKSNRPLLIKLWVGFFLGGIQGGVGWFMVKSGLSNLPQVSHFRLAFHLNMAFLIICFLVWQILEINKITLKEKLKFLKIKSQQNLWVWASLILLLMQIFYGALTAGLKAGYAYSTYPLMGGQFIPKELILVGLSLDSFINSVVGVQFVHRHFAVLVLIVISINFITFIKTKNNLFKKIALLLLFAVFTQFSLGVFTLVLHMPVFLALAHQFMALILLILIITQIKLINLCK